MLGFGLEPLSENFSYDNFIKIFKNRWTAIKNVLLNQKCIAGIGNIYADEICFYARVRPDRGVKTLSRAEKRRLHRGIKRILTRAVENRGTTFSDYIDSSGKKGNYSSQLMVYGREGKKCLRCNQGIITKIKLSQRGTHFCPMCQK